MNKSILGLILLILLISCLRSRKTDLNGVKEEDISLYSNELALISVTNFSRCQMSQLIQSVSKCNPKAIGINFLFVELMDSNCDSLLFQSMRDAQNVILVEGFEDGKHIESNKLFTEAAYLTGLTGLAQSEDGVTDYYYKIIDHRGNWEFSFPFLLALQYNKNRAAELSSKASPNDYPINFYSKKDLAIFTYKDIPLTNCEMIRKKIVIIGDLQTDDNVFVTRISKYSSAKTSGSVIIANIIIDILKELDSNSSESIAIDNNE